MNDALFPYVVPKDAVLPEKVAKPLRKLTKRSEALAALIQVTEEKSSLLGCLKPDAASSWPFSVLPQPSISQHAWALFMDVVRRHFAHTPFFCPTDGSDKTFLQACLLPLVNPQLRASTHPLTLEPVQLVWAELSVPFDVELLYDLELSLSTSGGAAVLGAVQLYCRGILVDWAKFEPSGESLLRATLLQRGLPLLALPRPELKVRLAVELLHDVDIAVRMEARAAQLSSAQQQALRQSCLLVESPPCTVHRRGNLLMIWQGQLVSHIVGGDLGNFDHSTASGLLRCAREFAPHLAPAPLAPHALSCPTCRAPALEQLALLE